MDLHASTYLDRNHEKFQYNRVKQTNTTCRKECKAEKKLYTERKFHQKAYMVQSVCIKIISLSNAIQTRNYWTKTKKSLWKTPCQEMSYLFINQLARITPTQKLRTRMCWRFSVN